MARETSKVPLIDVPCLDSSLDHSMHRVIIERTTERTSYSTITIDASSGRGGGYGSKTVVLEPKRAAPEMPLPVHAHSRSVGTYTREDQDGDLDELADQLLEQLGLSDDNYGDIAPRTPASTSVPSEPTSSSKESTKLALKGVLKPATTTSTSKAAISKTTASEMKKHVSSPDKSKTSNTRPSSTQAQSENRTAAKSGLPCNEENKLSNLVKVPWLASMSTSPSSSRTQSESSDNPLSSKSSLSTTRRSTGNLANTDDVPNSCLDAIYADIIDLENQGYSSKVSHAANQSRFGKIVRRMKKFGNLRLATDRPILQVDYEEEPLGIILAPPAGSNHFEVQLTICGLLRRNAASPYELYHFFLANGFYSHLPSPPVYEAWAADYSKARKDENAFYWEGVRVGITGDMDFLRSVFQEWCEAWHDWRLQRPLTG